MTTNMYDPNREEIFHVAGDVADPTGTGLRGQQSSVSLDTKIAEVQIRYKDTLIFGDVYRYPGVPLRVVLMCPVCHNALTVCADRKAIDYDLEAAPKIGGRISIEKFECPFEAPGAGAHNPRAGAIGIITGTKMCGWKVGVDNNVAKDA